jgi:hypothetical protein
LNSSGSVNAEILMAPRKWPTPRPTGFMTSGCDRTPETGEPERRPPPHLSSAPPSLPARRVRRPAP